MEDKNKNKKKQFFIHVVGKRFFDQIRKLDRLNEKYPYLQPFNSEYFWWMNLYLFFAFGIMYFSAWYVSYILFFY